MSSHALVQQIAAARKLLGIKHLMLTVHDASFPGHDAEDIGRGSPYSRGAEDLLRFSAEVGFDNLQLGPQGKTSLPDPSPYNGALFARSHQSLDLARLLEDPDTRDLLEGATLERAVHGRPPDGPRCAAHEYSWRVLNAACDAAYRRFAERPSAFVPLARELQAFAQSQAHWLVADGLYEALCELHGADHFSQWSEHEDGELDRRLYRPSPGEEQRVQARRAALLANHAPALNRNTFVQLLLHREHQALRERASALGVRLWADLQIGYAARDLWRWQAAFLPHYQLGAPPSRTNPDGQPWGYPVLDPEQLDRDAAGAGGPPSAATHLLSRRVSRLLDDFDGLRIDHPHGLVCPWVYRNDDDDPAHAVLTGARLRSAPASAAHAELARFAIARLSDLAPEGPQRLPYADAWVARLSDEQVVRYSQLFDLIIEQMARHGREPSDLAAEVLSTCPYPLARVLARHRLGRFRVVQKANPGREDDPYRSARAAPEDWIMLGTHDTAPIWSVVREWNGSTVRSAWASYLAERLEPRASERGALAGRIASDPRALVHALFADLFVGPARHVSVFFPDLFGLEGRYNSPGTVGAHNWRLRVPSDFRTRYERDRRAGDALDVAAALALALHARGADQSGEGAELARSLRARASRAALLEV